LFCQEERKNSNKPQTLTCLWHANYSGYQTHSDSEPLDGGNEALNIAIHQLNSGKYCAICHNTFI